VAFGSPGQGAPAGDTYLNPVGRLNCPTWDLSATRDHNNKPLYLGVPDTLILYCFPAVNWLLGKLYVKEKPKFGASFPIGVPGTANNVVAFATQTGEPVGKAAAKVENAANKAV